jgi:hypothetical protein
MEILPADIRSVIVDFMDNESRRRMRLASTTWFKIIRYDNFVFHYVQEDRFEQICQKLSRYNFPLQLTLQDLKFEFSKQHFDQLGQLTQLINLGLAIDIFEIPVGEFCSLTNLTNLENVGNDWPLPIKRHFPNLKVMRCTDEFSPETDVPLFSKLEAIHWDTEGLFAQSMERMSALPNKHLVTSLSMFGTPRQQRLDDINGNLVKFSNLKELIVSSYIPSVTYNSWNIPKLPNLESLKMMYVNNIASFSTDCGNLTSLELHSSEIDTSALLALTNLKVLRLDCKIDYSALGALTGLKSLFLRFFDIVGDSSFHFLTGLSNLEEFQLKTIKAKEMDWGIPMDYLMPNNLKELNIDAEIGYSFHHLTKFSNLEVLVLKQKTLASTDGEYLVNLKNLQEVHLNLTPESFNAIECLTTVKRLNLTITDMVGAGNGLQLQLGKFVDLEEVNFTTNYTVNIPANVNLLDSGSLSILTKLKTFASNWPSYNIFTNVSQCPTLSKIAIGNTSITDDLTLMLTSLTNLQNCEIWANTGQFTGIHLTLLTTLRTLRLISTCAISYDLKEKLPKLGICFLSCGY